MPEPRRLIPALLITLAVVMLAPPARAQRRGPTAADLESLPFEPRRMVCYRTATPLTIDGRLDEPAWQAVAWSEPFIDIDGVQKPRFATRMKMLWDDEYLYVGADLEEPGLWATLTERDSIIFRDHDFEVFIDPDGDTHVYYELEINALNTVWDLMLVKPYRDGGPAIHAWDIAGLKTGVHLRGTLNDPGDRDEGWSVEIAMPWSILREAAREHRAPRDGEQWRVNYSRVEWTLDVVDGKYVKRMNPDTGRPLPEDNWVWSPQGVINMHVPERWGFVQFTDAVAGTREVAFVDYRNERVKWALRRLYYRQRDYRAQHGRYADSLDALDAANITVDGLEFRPTLAAAGGLYEISAPGFDGATVHIRHDGRVWVTRRNERR